MKYTKLFPLALLVLVAGCSMVGSIETSLGATAPLAKPVREVNQTAASKSAPAKDQRADAAAQSTQFFKTPLTPSATVSSLATAPAPQAAPNSGDETVSAVTLDGIPLPQFINTIYSTVLKRNVSVDPAIQTRTDLVSLRTGRPQSATQLSFAAQTVLRSYGVSINEFEGLVRAVPSAGVGGATPEIMRGRAQPDVPSAIRPIFYLVELENTSQANAGSWVRTLFQGRVTVTEDAPRNSLMLSGQSDSVMAAVEAIQTLDRPGMRGRFSARITPVFWSAADLATRLVDVLSAQGYYAGANALAPTPILIMPVPQINSVVVFAATEEALNHTLRWATQLDQTQPTRSGGRYITYYVRNTDANDVAKTLQDVLSGGGSSVTPAAPAAPGVAAAPRTVGNSRVVVNSAANSIIIQSSPAEYQQIYGLLQELDRPARSALIMATVAEVSLADDEQFGFNWLLAQFNSGGYIVNGGIGPKPTGGVTSASGIALNIASIAGDPRALLTALATSSKVRVLSNPSIVTISGQQASIQVGQDVPILTSQISNANTGTGTGQGVLQTVQYRNVGVILKVKPTIRAGGRVDLEIGQEVSGVSTVATGLGNSPVVNTRRVETRLSTVDGNTMLIGGLITEQREGANAGVPYLKDIPMVGGLFRTSGSTKSSRTEMVLLITPYVMEDDFDSRAMTEAFRGQFAWGKDLSVSVRDPSKAEVPAGVETPEAVVLPAVISEPYKVPELKDEKPPAAAPIRAKSRDLSGMEPLNAPAAQGQSSAASPANANAGGVTRELTDERLKQELLDTIRGGKK